MAQRTAEQVIEEREFMTCQLEEADRRMRASGLHRSWFQSSDDATVQVAGGCNGCLFEALLKATKYSDWECCDLLRHGNVASLFLLWNVCVSPT